MGKINPIFVETITACILAQKGDRSLRQLCADAGLPASDNALLSKLLRGESVSVATLRRIGCALGCVAPPRRLIRRCMSAQEAAAWDALAPAERLRRLTTTEKDTL